GGGALLLSRGDVPDAHGRLPAAAEHLLAVGAEHDLLRLRLPALPAERVLLGGQAQQADLAAPAARDRERLAVGGEGDRLRPADLADGAKLLAGEVPQPHHLIATARSDLPAVVREGDAVDARGVPDAAELLGARLGVPDADELVVAAGGEELAVG